MGTLCSLWQKLGEGFVFGVVSPSRAGVRQEVTEFGIRIGGVAAKGAKSEWVVFVPLVLFVVEIPWVGRGVLGDKKDDY